MKTTQFCLLLLLCTATQGTRAQHFYAGLGGGYGFPAAKQSFENDETSIASPGAESTEYTARPISLGKGINTSLFFGYMLNANLGFELGASYLLGSKNELINEHTETDFSGGTYNYNNALNYQGRMIRLVPTLRFSIGEQKFRPYMKVGLLVSFGNKFSREYSFNSNHSNGGSSSGEFTMNYSGGISLGFHGGLGLNYRIKDKLVLFVECAANYQNWAPLKGSMTKYTFNGDDLLPDMDIKDKEVEYVNSYTEDSTTAYNPNEPSTELKFYMPFSSIALNIGLVITFGKKANSFLLY